MPLISGVWPPKLRSGYRARHRQRGQVQIQQNCLAQRPNSDMNMPDSTGVVAEGYGQILISRV